jgi:hypothetical protein
MIVVEEREGRSELTRRTRKKFKLLRALCVITPRLLSLLSVFLFSREQSN